MRHVLRVMNKVRLNEKVVWMSLNNYFMATAFLPSTQPIRAFCIGRTRETFYQILAPLEDDNSGIIWYNVPPVTV
jgi:hypothetical protein